MSDRDPDALARLGEKLRAASSRKKVLRTERPRSKLGIAFRLSTEFVAAAVVGGGIGWILDRIFGTSPIFLLVMFVFGVAAGFRNLIRAANEMNEIPDSPPRPDKEK